MPVEKSDQDGNQTENVCLSCRGRGWKLRTSRRELLVRAGSTVVCAAVADCTSCAGSGLAEAA